MSYADSAVSEVSTSTLIGLLDSLDHINNLEIGGTRFPILADSDKQVFTDLKTILPFVTLKLRGMSHEAFVQIPSVHDIMNRLEMFTTTIKEMGMEKAYSVIDVSLLRKVIDKLVSGIYAVELNVVQKPAAKKSWW